MSIAPNGQASFNGFTLRGLIIHAWDIQAPHHIVSPVRLDETRFQVVAKFDPSSLPVESETDESQSQSAGEVFDGPLDR